jgi:hypothetical protein
MEGIFESNSPLGEQEKIMTTSNKLEDEDFESNWENEEEDEDSKSNWEYEEEDEETSDFNEDTNVNQGGFVNMFSMLFVTSPTKDNGSIVSSHVNFARDYLWKRHLISRSEMIFFWR